MKVTPPRYMLTGSPQNSYVFTRGEPKIIYSTSDELKEKNIQTILACFG